MKKSPTWRTAHLQRRQNNLCTVKHPVYKRLEELLSTRSRCCCGDCCEDYFDYEFHGNSDSTWKEETERMKTRQRKLTGKKLRKMYQRGSVV